MSYTGQQVFDFFDKLEVLTGEQLREKKAVPKNQAEMMEKFTREWYGSAPAKQEQAPVNNQKPAKIRCSQRK